MNDVEIRRLAHAVNDLRPDWPISSLTTFIGKHLRNRPYRDAVVALVWVAVDMRPDGQPATDTPKRVLEAGPWWRAALVENPQGGRAVPVRAELWCAAHVGQPASNCGGCRADHLAGDTTPRPHDTSGTNHEAHIKACRDAIAAGVEL